MKTELTVEQTKHLRDLGINEFPSEVELLDGHLYEVFSLTDLLEILPEEIMLDKEHGLDFGWDFYAKKWFAKYSDEDSMCVYEEAQYLADELIDALYQLTYWYYGKYLKNKRNEKDN